jgi:ABC-type transport system involved in multi-copper enzyme maturation permease subunit
VIEIVRRTLRQRWKLLLIGFALSLIGILAEAGGAGADAVFAPTILVAVLLSIGIVARDVRTGAVQMILARPIRRSSYLAGRYLGVVVLIGAFVAVNLLAGAVATPSASRGALVPGLVSAATAAFLQGGLTAALILFFSTFLPGVGDVIFYVLLQLGFDLVYGLSRARSARAAAALLAAKSQILPDPDWGRVFSDGRWLDPAVAAWILALTAALAGANWIFSRRQFGYGRD